MTHSSDSDESRLQHAREVFRTLHAPGTLTRTLTDLYARDATGSEAAETLSKHPALKDVYGNFLQSVKSTRKQLRKKE
jgi:hypothetical protein